MLGDQDKYLDRVSLLESRDLIDRIYHSIHKLNLNSTKAEEVLAYVSQSRSYQLAADKADEIVKLCCVYSA